MIVNCNSISLLHNYSFDKSTQKSMYMYNCTSCSIHFLLCNRTGYIYIACAALKDFTEKLKLRCTAQGPSSSPNPRRQQVLNFRVSILRFRGRGNLALRGRFFPFSIRRLTINFKNFATLWWKSRFRSFVSRRSLTEFTLSADAATMLRIRTATLVTSSKKANHQVLGSSQLVSQAEYPSGQFHHDGARTRKFNYV